MLADAIDAAKRYAPKCKTLTQVATAVNEELGLDWTAGKWRGIWKDKPVIRFDVEQLLGQDLRKIEAVKTFRGDYKIAVGGDMHVPYHDPNVIALFCKVLKWWKPDKTILNGDLNDFEGISRFDKDPRRKTTAQGEIDQTKRELFVPVRQAVGNADVEVVPGNHDNRFEKLLWQYPDLFSIRATTLPELWELERFDIGYASHAIRFGDDLEVTHGVKVSTESGYSVTGELRKRHWGVSVLMNHIHRLGYVNTRVGRGWRHGLENGCMCDLEPSYMTDANWAHGFSIGHIKNHNVWLQPVSVFPDYTCCVNGKWFGLD